MSQSTLSPTPDDFDDLEFAAIVADFDTEKPRPARRPSGWPPKREAIDNSLGFRRHRSREREA